MFSPLKVVLFAFISFAALALAIPSPASSSEDPRALILGCNDELVEAVLPLRPFYLTVYTSFDSCSHPPLRLSYPCQCDI